jgi:hypothetical protein
LSSGSRWKGNRVQSPPRKTDVGFSHREDEMIELIRSLIAASWRRRIPFAVALVCLSSPKGLLAQDPRPVSIIGLDYAFQAPDTLRAGPAIFSFLNRGSVRHEMVLYVLNDGRTLGDYLRATTAEERRPLGRAVGLILAEPGQPALGRLVVDLVTGQSYVLICNLRDAPDKTPHNALGMGKALAVK